MKKCNCSGGINDIVRWETPENSYWRRFGRNFMYICAVCGYTAWPTGYSNAVSKQEAEEAIQQR